MKLSCTFLALVGTVATSVSVSALATTHAKPAHPTFTYLYTLNTTFDPAIQMGTASGPRGSRVAIPITGGSFTGSQLSGKVLNLGADWGLTDSKGFFTADARYNILTDDGTNIFVQTSGSRQADGFVHLRILFETGSEKYYWLNNILAVGIETIGDGYVVIDAWQVESPRQDAVV